LIWEKEIPPIAVGKPKLEESCIKNTMSNVRNFAEITPNLPFSEFIFYELYRETFEKSELGRMKKILPLLEKAESLGLVSKSMAPKRGRKSYFPPEGKVALMFLKSKHLIKYVY